jgi:neurotransmitter:Na+ symporter, NSS family
MSRDSWKSRLGFVLAASGSAVGLVNIWRFPYVVYKYGGGAFILVYLLFLVVIGFPVLCSEVLIGRTAKQGPARAMRELSHIRAMGKVGGATVVTGFVVSSFYSVVAGWVIGYLVQAVSGGFGGLETTAEATQFFQGRVASTVWCVGYHLLFMVLATLLLSRGVRKGLELGNEFLMPVLVLLLIVLMVRGLTLPGGGEGIGFLFELNWGALTGFGILTALGHAFFTLSLGQGTMITYGSYLSGKEQLPRTCAPVVVFDTFISLLAGVAVMSVVFAGGQSVTGGEGLIFSTLPVVFGELPGGQAIAIAFFFLILLAALTSQVSAMEPPINHLVHCRGWKRVPAVMAVGGGAFLVGVPSALSFGVWKGTHLFSIISSVTMDVLIPLGGLIAVLFVGWIWGFRRAFPHLFGNLEDASRSHRILRGYLSVTIKYVAPALIFLILVTSLVT